MAIEDVSPSKALELIASRTGMVVLDVRERADFAEGHIQGATSVPLTDLQARIFDLDPDRPTLVYCYSGNTSQGACSLLEVNGFAKIYHLHGGFDAWLREGLPVSKFGR